MKTSFYVISALLFLACTACENTIKYKESEQEPKLIVNALLNTDNEENYVYLNLSGAHQTTEVTDGIVDLYINGVLQETSIALSPNGTSTNIYPINTPIHAGDRIRIEASDGYGYRQAWAETSVPHRPQIIHIDTTTVSIKKYYDSNYTEEYWRMKIKMRSLSGEKSYFRIVSEKREVVEGVSLQTGNDSTFTFKTYDYIAREDIALTDGRPSSPQEEDVGILTSTPNKYGIFEDRYFSNGEYTLTINVPKSSWWYDSLEDTSKRKKKSTYMRIKLIAISDTEFQYLRTLNFYDSDNYDETMSEPIRFFSNVNNGLGIVGAGDCESQEMLMEVKEYNLSFMHPNR